MSHQEPFGGFGQFGDPTPQQNTGDREPGQPGAQPAPQFGQPAPGGQPAQFGHPAQPGPYGQPAQPGYQPVPSGPGQVGQAFPMAARSDRIKAASISFGIQLAVVVVLFVLLSAVTGDGKGVFLLSPLVGVYSLAVLALVFVKSATPGQLLTGLRVVRTDGWQPNGPWAVLKQLAIGVVSSLTCGIGALVGVLIHDEKTGQNLFDRILGVNVVDVRKGASAVAPAPAPGAPQPVPGSYGAGRPTMPGQPAPSTLPPGGLTWSDARANVPGEQSDAPQGMDTVLGDRLWAQVAKDAAEEVGTPPVAPSSGFLAGAPSPVPTPITQVPAPGAPTRPTPAAPSVPPVPSFGATPPGPPQPIQPPVADVPGAPQAAPAQPVPAPFPSGPGPASVSLHLDGGEALVLDRAWVLGRDPVAPPQAPHAGSHPVADESKSISKTHVLLTPHPIGAEVTDLHSTNGVSVETTAGTVVRVAPGVPTPVPPGTVVHYGNRRVTVSR